MPSAGFEVSAAGTNAKPTVTFPAAGWPGSHRRLTDPQSAPSTTSHECSVRLPTLCARPARRCPADGESESVRCRMSGLTGLAAAEVEASAEAARAATTIVAVSRRLRGSHHGTSLPSR